MDSHVALEPSRSVRLSTATGVAFDRLFVRVPFAALDVAPAVVIGLTVASIALVMPALLASVAVLSAIATVLLRARLDRARRTLIARVPQMRRRYQLRYAIIRRHVRRMSARMGIEPPVVLIDPISDRTALNMGVLLDGPPVLLVTPALLDPEIIEDLDETTLEGIVAHEIAHLRPGRRSHTGLRLLYRGCAIGLVCQSVSAVLILGLPPVILLASVITWFVVSMSALLTRRREELEATIIAPTLFEVGGSTVVTSAIARINFLQARLWFETLPRPAWARRLYATLLAGERIGAFRFRHDELASWILEQVCEDDAPKTVRGRCRTARNRLEMPFSSHPSLTSSARLVSRGERLFREPEADDLAA